MGRILLFSSLEIQYCIVGGTLVAALVWSICKIIKARKISKNNGDELKCGNCGLADSCNKLKNTKRQND